MKYTIVYSVRALAQLEKIFDDIAERSDPLTARYYTQRLELAYQNLEHLPLRATPRDDIRPGLRTTTYLQAPHDYCFLGRG